MKSILNKLFALSVNLMLFHTSFVSAGIGNSYNLNNQNIKSMELLELRSQNFEILDQKISELKKTLDTEEEEKKPGRVERKATNMLYTHFSNYINRILSIDPDLITDPDQYDLYRKFETKEITADDLVKDAIKAHGSARVAVKKILNKTLGIRAFLKKTGLVLSVAGLVAVVGVGVAGIYVGITLIVYANAFLGLGVLAVSIAGFAGAPRLIDMIVNDVWENDNF